MDDHLCVLRRLFPKDANGEDDHVTLLVVRDVVGLGAEFSRE